jgi:hypothetical protein
MAGYLSTTKTFSLSDSYIGDREYWIKATVTVTIAADGKISYTIKMTNDHAGSMGRAVYLNIKINGTTVQGPKYYHQGDPGNYGWCNFPTGHNTSRSSFLDTKTTKDSISVSITIACMQSASSVRKTDSFTLTRDKWTNVTKGTVSISDNGNNTFTLYADKGTKGTNNTVSSSSFKWGYNTDYENTFTNGQTVTIPSDVAASSATVPVYAKCVTKGQRGDTATAYAELAVKHYVSPSNPGKPTITYNKSRLTIKENWKINWKASTAANTNSPVVGYRIRFWKKPKGGSSFSTIKFYRSTGELLSSDLGSDYGTKRYYYDRPASYDMPLTIVPSAQSISPGDTIKIGIYAYTVNAKSTKLWSSSEVYSNEYLVQNAGVVRVTLDGSTWKEGIVNIYVDGAWREADLVNAYRDGAWVESE